MSSLKHIIITRFNSIYSGTFKYALDETWISDRWELFRSHTVPSLIGQTNKNFLWLIECHPESPSLLRRLITASNSDLPANFAFVFDKRECLGMIKPLSNYDVVLCTRLDSDDALHRDAVKRIQESKLDVDILNFETGYQYDLLAGRVAILHRDSSPFSTKVNHIARGDNPFDTGGDHTYLSHRYSYRDICHGDPMWCQVLHPHNLANQWDGNPFLNRYLSKHILDACFSISQSEYARRIRLIQYARVTLSGLKKNLATSGCGLMSYSFCSPCYHNSISNDDVA